MVLTDIIKSIGEPIILRKSIQFTDEPRFYKYTCDFTSDEIDNDCSGSSISLDEETAKVKATGEAIERYSLEDRKQSPQIIGSFTELTKKGHNLINPRKFQREIKEEDRHRKLKWSYGIDLTNNQEILVPSQLIYIPYYSDFQEPLIRNPTSTGAAFGTDKTTAIERGILEVIERDSFLRWWTSNQKLRKIEGSSEIIKELRKYFNRYLLDVNFFDITQEMGIPTVATILVDRTTQGPYFSTGLKSAYSQQGAMIGSLMEAQQVREYNRFQMLKGEIPKINDPRKVMDSTTRTGFWAYRNKKNNFERIIEQSEVEDEKTTETKQSALEKCISQGHQVIYTDISPKKLKVSQYVAIKVIIPSMHPLDSNAEENKNKLPHPFI